MNTPIIKYYRNDSRMINPPQSHTIGIEFKYLSVSIVWRSKLKDL
jgi:hypothetical protein